MATYISKAAREFKWAKHFQDGHSKISVFCEQRSDYQAAQKFAHNCCFLINRWRGRYQEYEISRPPGHYKPYKKPFLKRRHSEGPCNECTSKLRCKSEKIACGEFQKFVTQIPGGITTEFYWDTPTIHLYDKIFNYDCEDK